MTPITGRFISRDAIDIQFNNYYEYLSSSPLSARDPSGHDRYITWWDPTGLIGGEMNWHVGVAVDTYACVNGEFVKNGTMTFDFSVAVDYGAGLIGGTIVWRGQVIPSEGLNLGNPITFGSTPCEDIAMLAELQRQVSNPSPFSALLHNCIWWSVGAVNYGMGAQPALDAAICAPPCSCVLGNQLYTLGGGD